MTKVSLMTGLRQFVVLGLLGYLASFFLLGPTAQKSIFYILVALPSFFLVADIRKLIHTSAAPILLIFAFLAYYVISSVWSDARQIDSSIKVALSIFCLMVAVKSIMSMHPASPLLIRNYIITVGAIAAAFYVGFMLDKLGAAGSYASLASKRFALADWSGWGDRNPINSAIYFGLVVLAAWWSLPNSRILTKLCLLLLIVACMTIMLLSQSRGPILSIAIVIALISALRRSRDDWILGSSVLLIGGIAVIYFDISPIFLERINSPNYRSEIWLQSLGLIRDNLFFGQGVGQSVSIPFFTENNGVVTVSHSHSSFLEAFRVGGLMGGGIFLAMTVWVLRRSFALTSDRGFFAFWLIYGLLCLATNGRSLFIRPSVEWFAFWIPLFFALFSSAKATPACLDRAGKVCLPPGQDQSR